MSWCGVLWVYKANERRKRQREADRSTCRKLHLSPTKIPQYIQSDHLFVPSGRSKCISHKQDREVNAGVPPKHVSAILGASHILKLWISYKVANDIACSCSQAIFPPPGKLDRECWPVASPYEAVLLVTCPYRGIGQEQEKKKRKKEKKRKEKVQIVWILLFILSNCLPLKEGVLETFGNRVQAIINPKFWQSNPQ
jgi:hypothetical protein